MLPRRVARQWDTAATTRMGDPGQVVAATVTTGLRTAFQAAKYTGTRQQAVEQPVNFV